MSSLKEKYYSWKINRRYKKFKNCSLPNPLSGFIMINQDKLVMIFKIV